MIPKSHTEQIIKLLLITLGLITIFFEFYVISNNCTSFLTYLNIILGIGNIYLGGLI